jgi:hypothetical protein
MQCVFAPIYDINSLGVSRDKIVIGLYDPLIGICGLSFCIGKVSKEENSREKTDEENQVLSLSAY